MPIKKQAFKALRKSEKRRRSNRAINDEIREMRAKIIKLASDKKLDDAADTMKLFQKKVDKAASRHIIHKNRAARLKGRIVKIIKKSR